MIDFLEVKENEEYVIKLTTRARREFELNLAKELFLKTFRSQLFLNDQNQSQYDADINNCLKIAKLFVEKYEQTNRHRRN